MEKYFPSSRFDSWVYRINRERQISREEGSQICLSLILCAQVYYQGEKVHALQDGEI